MWVLAEEGANRDVESEDVPPAGHELQGNEGSTLPGRHEGVDSKDESELGHAGYKVIEVSVSNPVF